MNNYYFWENEKVLCGQMGASMVDTKNACNPVISPVAFYGSQGYGGGILTCLHRARI
jgi:hypothetical protein